jgi:hypothetical protein
MSETVLDLGILRPVPGNIFKQRNRHTGASLPKRGFRQGVKQLKLMRLPRQGLTEQLFSFGCIADPNQEHPKLPGYFEVSRMLTQPSLEQFDGFREAVASCQF